MPADRKVPAPSNTPGGGISGTSFMEDVLTEVQALYRYVQIPLSDVAGTNTITASCDVALDVRAKGNKFTFTPVAANTGAATLEINGKGPLPLRDRLGAVLAAGRLAIGRSEVVEDFATEYRLMLDAPAAGQSLLHSVFAYQLATNTNAPASVVGWQKIPLNTIVLNELGLTFNGATNQVTLAALTYDWVRGVQMMGGFSNSLVLWNVSDNVPFTGMVRRQAYNWSPVETEGKFTLATPKVAELRVYCSNATANGLGGFAANITSPSALPEQYGYLDIRSLS